MRNDIVEITCYGSTRKYKRYDAMREFKEGIYSSDGSERDRYEYIYFQLEDGATIINDENAL